MPEARRGPVNRGTLPMRIPPALNVHRHDTDNRTLVTLAGEIDLNSAPLVRASLERCLYDGIRAIDVDVTAVTFCDCSGLNAFLYALLHTSAAGGSLRLVHPSPALERLVTLTGSGSLFLTLPDALAGSRPPSQLPPLYETTHHLTPALPARLGGVV
ncbi:STAS domain-containing protein [Streptomyces umbrinus]|uniref:STAS domain-containing protein n=1 Tax=Streptomyces umbrinus TaxID=67370 RepID=UPI0033CFEB6B